MKSHLSIIFSNDSLLHKILLKFKWEQSTFDKHSIQLYLLSCPNEIPHLTSIKEAGGVQIGSKRFYSLWIKYIWPQQIKTIKFAYLNLYQKKVFWIFKFWYTIQNKISALIKKRKIFSRVTSNLSKYLHLIHNVSRFL